MKRLYFLFFAFMVMNSCQSLSQSKQCSTLYTERLAIDDPKRTYEQIAALLGCGMDSADLIIFKNPTMVGSFLVNWTNTKKDTLPTVGDFYNRCKVMIGTKEYADLKKEISDANPGEVKSAVTTNELQTATSTNNYLAKYKTTYSGYCDTAQITATPYRLIAFNSYTEGMKCAQKTGKRVLIYFTGAYCVTCRKMEQGVLEDDEIRQLIDSNFIFIVLTCDDRTVSKISGKTIGSINAVIEEDQFKSYSQPYFVITKSNGQVISKQEYTTMINDFQYFLKHSL